ncbi:hypothetical protein KO361_01565 [Candidatus Woesearchaeota archaeon]|nr:hypothetical protein [Candidatus Woesearchaeota archaeon]
MSERFKKVKNFKTLRFNKDNLIRSVELNIFDFSTLDSVIAINLSNKDSWPVEGVYEKKIDYDFLDVIFSPNTRSVGAHLSLNFEYVNSDFNKDNLINLLVLENDDLTKLDVVTKIRFFVGDTSSLINFYGSLMPNDEFSGIARIATGVFGNPNFNDLKSMDGLYKRIGQTDILVQSDSKKSFFSSKSDTRHTYVRLLEFEYQDVLPMYRK